MYHVCGNKIIVIVKKILLLIKSALEAADIDTPKVLMFMVIKIALLPNGVLTVGANHN